MTSLHIAESRTLTVTVEGRELVHCRPPLHQQGACERSAGSEEEEIVERLGIVALRVLGNDRVEHHLPELNQTKIDRLRAGVYLVGEE